MKKLLFRFLLPFLLILISTTAIASILLNNFLARSKVRIEHNLSNISNQNVFIERISFFPPNFIFLKNASIQHPGPPRKTQPIFIERVKCRFSLPMLISKREFIIVKMSIDRPTINYFFIKENIKEILKVINSLTQQYPFNIKIRGARLDLSDQEGQRRWINLDATSIINPNNSVFSSGLISLEGLFKGDDSDELSLSPETASLRYNFRAFLTKEGWMVENVELNSPLFCIRLSGMTEKNVLKMDGSLSLNILSGITVSSKNSHTIIDRLKNILPLKRKAYFLIPATSAYDLNSYDLTCTIKLDFPSIYIEDFSFSLKDIPFLLTGSILLLQSPTLKLNLISFPNQTPEVRLNNPKSFDISLTGVLQEGKFNTTVNLDFLKMVNEKQSLQRLGATLKNLTLSSTPDKKTKMAFEKAILSYEKNDNLFVMLLDDFNAFFNPEGEIVKLVQFSSHIYDGLLEGKGVLDVSQIPPKNSFDIRIQDISATRLHHLLTYCSKIYGTLSSQIHYKNHPKPALTGKLALSDGLLDNIIFFQWVADFFRIPSLNKINFDSLSAEFIVDNESAGVEKILLESKDINFKGNFTLHKNDLVSSKLSLFLSRELLNTSNKFAPLLRFIDKDVASVRFDFQLSGLFQSMNFKWSESDFKQLLQKLLPSRMEKGLEIEVENIIQSISE